MEELSYGISYFEPRETKLTLTIEKRETVDLKKTFLKEDSYAFEEVGFAGWLSVVTQNVPALVCSVAASAHPLWCDHTCFVTVFRPQQTQPVTWAEVKSIPISCCLQSLAVNPFNRDMFAAGTIAGDLYIWRYDSSDDGQPIKELFNDSTKAGSVMDMDFYKLSPYTDDVGLLTCHDDGKVCSWKVGKVVVPDKTVRFFDIKRQYPYSLQAICVAVGSEFYVGALDGTIMGPCMTSRVIDSSDGQHQDCVAEKFAKQRFTIVKLQRIAFKAKECLLSSDFSSEIHIYNLGDPIGIPIFSFRLPMLTDHYFILWQDYILIARPAGELKYLQYEGDKSGEIGNNLRGNPSCIAVSRMQNWLVTGSFEGRFQVFTIEKKED